MRINLQQFSRGGRVDVAAVMSAITERTSAEGAMHQTLYVPVGHYHMADLALPSRTTVLLDPGARVSVSLPGRSLFTADGAELVSIVGQGIIDGGCDSEGAKHSAPPLLRFSACQRLRIEGVRIEGSAGPTLTLDRCHHVDIERIQLTTVARADGLHILGGLGIRLTHLQVDTGGTGLLVTATGRNSLDQLTVRDSAFACAQPAITLLADGGRLDRVRFHQCRVSGSQSTFCATAVGDGRIDGLAVDECTFTDGGVLVDGTGGTIGGLSLLSLRCQAPVTLRRVAAVTVCGEQQWLSTARLNEVDFVDVPRV